MEWGARCLWCWTVCPWPSNSQVIFKEPGTVAAHLLPDTEDHIDLGYLCYDCVHDEDESVLNGPDDYWPGDLPVSHVAIIIPAPCGPEPVVWCLACEGPSPPRERDRVSGLIYCLATGQHQPGWTAPIFFDDEDD